MAEIPDPRVAPRQPTLYFIGVTTGKSSAQRMFPLWMEELGRSDVVLAGLDFPIHAGAAAYRAAVPAIKRHPLALGAIVTTHKIDLVESCRDLIDELEPDAALLGEISSLAKRGDRLVGRATDPSAGGLSLGAFLPPGHFGRTGAHVLCFGAGGSATALALHFAHAPQRADRPSRMILVDRSQERLDRLRRILLQIDSAIDFQLIRSENPREHDYITTALPARSLIVNATGMGKDLPGSPLTDRVDFPNYAYIWDFNYRGELLFLKQARLQQNDRNLTVVDGWTYFVNGWSQVIAHILDITISPEEWQRLANLAAAVR